MSHPAPPSPYLQCQLQKPAIRGALSVNLHEHNCRVQAISKLRDELDCVGPAVIIVIIIRLPGMLAKQTSPYAGLVEVSFVIFVARDTRRKGLQAELDQRNVVHIVKIIVIIIIIIIMLVPSYSGHAQPAWWSNTPKLPVSLQVYHPASIPSI